VGQAKDAIRTFVDAWDDRCLPFVWTKVLPTANRIPKPDH
jgi:hypothetical protein